MRSIKVIIHLFFSLLANIGPMYKIKSMDEKGTPREERESYVHKVTTKWAASIVKSTGSTVEVFGEENLIENSPIVYISNHQSDFDVPILMSKVKTPKGFIAKIEMLKAPVVRTWMKYLHCVFMDRSNLRKSAAAIIEGVKILKEGNSLVIFPEGTRSKTGELLDFKSGSFKLATKAKVPIIPITIVGSSKIFEGNGNRIKPAHVKVYIHPPIYTKGLTKEEEDLLPEQVKAIVASKLN